MKKHETSQDPIQQFEQWYKEAMDTDLREPNAMTLSTVNAEGRPSGRVVLLKDFDKQGFVFFTNYNSPKGQALEARPYAALTFFWSPLERQVRIEGVAERVSEAASDEYFQTRPRGSQIGALFSPQSEVIRNRESLEEKIQQYLKEHPEGKVERPKHWGGYVVKPYLIEFWQGRPSRLHDRIRYILQDDGEWKKERLAP